MTKKLKIIKLVTGDDLLAEVTENSIATVTFKNPVRIVVVPTKDPRSPSVGFAPWGEFSQNKEFVIDKSHVVCTMVPIQEFVNQYNTMFSGILMPDKKIIL